jgi:hypothetical protein
MNKLCSLALILALFVGPMPAGVFAQEADPEDSDEVQQATETVPALPASPWPVRFEDAGTEFVVYQPEFDKWEGDRLEGRAAVAVTGEGAEAPEFGVVWLTAATQAGADGQVTIQKLDVGKADFPTLAARSGDYLAALRRQLEAKTWQVAQERLQNDLAIEDASRKAAAQPVRNDVPSIIFSEQPAILVPIDGAPVLRDVADTGLKRIVNTRALLLFDPVLVRYYLYASNRWMEATSFEGPWTQVTAAPASLEKAKEVAVQENQVDLLEPEEGEAVAAAPAIHVSTTPTELLQTDGPPQYSPIENTRLLYVANSPNRIFLDTATQTHYVLISGRWFRARNLGPSSWEYVSAAALPGDFARIPAEHETESVRAAVAGTPQAREAAIQNTVPQVATVNRTTTSLTVNYDGDPSFVPVEGTSLQRAVNAPIPVIRVSENAFYALDNGVWFTAGSPYGPWSVATSVPAVVYSIPRSSPIHYVTYVRVYDATPDVVYVGYTPGYVGSYISSDNVVVYGSGWHYRPWIGSYWYSAPVTWGFGFSFVHTWWHPWRPHRFHHHHHHHVHRAPPCFRPAWGPWHHRKVHRASVPLGKVTAVNRVNVRRNNVANIYNRWDRREVVRNRSVEPRRQAALERGRGVITRQDGTRQQFGERDRRNGRDRNDAIERRRGAGATPPAVQGNDRSALRNGADRARRADELPRIQGPNRRWDRDDDDRRRADRDRRRAGPQGAERNAQSPESPALDFRRDRDNDRRADQARRREMPRAAPDGQGPSRRWNRDDEGRRADRNRLDMPERRAQPPVVAMPRPDAGARSSPQVQRPRNPANSGSDANRQQRREWRQERRSSGAEMTRPQRREAAPAERRQFSRQERRDFTPRPQAQVQRPSAAPPVVRARPPSVSRPQARQSTPQFRAQRAAPQPRAQRRSEARPRAESRRHSGGSRNVGGRSFRPEAR